MSATEQADGLAGVRDRDCDDTEPPTVQTGSSPESRQVVEGVGAVADQDGLRSVDGLGVDSRPQCRPTLLTEQIRQHLQYRRRLVGAVLRAPHHLRVDTEGRVVDERATVDPAEIDAQFDTVAESAQARSGIVPVQPEIEGEMVPGSGADHHERKSMFRCDRRDQGLGSVATRHAEQVGPALDCLLRQFGDVELLRSAQQHHFRPEFFGLALQVETDDLAAARARIHDEEGMPNGHGRKFRLRSHPGMS